VALKHGTTKRHSALNLILVGTLDDGALVGAR